MVFLDKYGWPIEYRKNHPIEKWIRIILLTRKIERGYWNGYKIVKGNK